MAPATTSPSAKKNVLWGATALFGALALAAGCSADLAGPAADDGDCPTCDDRMLDGTEDPGDEPTGDPRGAVQSGIGTFSEGGGAAPPDEVTPPGAVTDLDGTTLTRRSIYASWTAPADADDGPVADYDIKVATEALTDENFATTGEPVDFDGTPSAPGQTDSITIDTLRAGTAYYVGVAAVDAAGNRSGVQSIGPITPDFTASAALTVAAPDSYDNGVGYAVAHGRFSDGDHDDVAVSAPFVDVDGQWQAGAVYVYFGGAGGIGATPDVVIEGVAEGGWLGFSMAALDWNGDGVTDLAIGAPYDHLWNGRVYIFYGGAGFGGGTGALTATDADVIIEAAPDDNWFTWSSIGWSLAAGRFDSDNRDDLAIGAPYGDGLGGVAIVYGGTTTSAVIQLSDAAGATANGAVVHLMAAPKLAANETFAEGLVNLGRNEGGAGTTTDRLGVASMMGASAYVIRGRPDRPAAEGVTPLAFDATIDAEIVSPDRYIRFGLSFGSIADQNEDGVRELVIGAFRANDDAGQVWIVDGDTVGVKPVADVALATITGPAGARFGSAVVNNAGVAGADIDGDRREDLLIVGGTADGSLALHIWYGGEIPTGAVSSASAAHTFAAPATFSGGEPSFGGPPVRAIWGGDATGDGLEDLYWSHWDAGDARGSFQLLHDPGI